METRTFVSRARAAAVAVVDGRPGIIVAPGARLDLVLRFAVTDGRIVAYEVIADPDRLAAVVIAVP